MNSRSCAQACRVLHDCARQRSKLAVAEELAEAKQLPACSDGLLRLNLQCTVRRNVLN
jgi:hypothetical protein